MIERTVAIALRISPFSRTSHVVTWLTSQAGKLVTVVKGALRPKSIFLGQYDLFQTCELLYYERGQEGLRIARECSPIRPRAGLRSDWRAAALASHVSSLAAHISLPRERPNPVFDLVSTALDLLEERGGRTPLVYWLELQVLRQAGVAPRLETCPTCGAPIPLAASHAFSCSRGGVLCATCAPTEQGSVMPIRADGLAILRNWQGATAQGACNTLCTPAQSASFRALLGAFLGYHLDLDPRCRSIALDLARM